MDKIRYTVTHNYDDPTLTQTFNADGREFPDLIYSQTSFELLHRAKKWDDFDNQNVVAMDLTSMTAANLYIKPKNNVLTPTSIATGSVVGAATDGIILFTVDKDVISNSLAQFTTDSNPTPIVLYLVIESSDNGKFSLETDIRIMDINRDGNNEATTFEAATIGYTPEQSAKWTSQYWSSPTGTAEALDKLARVDHTDRGSIISQLATPPGSPADGDKYLVIATGTGDWVGLEDSLVEWNSTAGSWLAHTPREGDEFYDKNLNDRYRYNGSAWVATATGDFSGPGSSTDNAIVRFDGTGGKTGQNSGVLIDDSNNISGAANIGHTGSLNDTNGNEYLKHTATGSAVNELTITNAATGTNPKLAATGDDTNISLELQAKGTGNIKPQNDLDLADTQDLINVPNLDLTTYSELTIATGAVTATQVMHTLDTESDAAADDLDTITKGVSNLLLITLANAARIVTLKDGTGNLDIGADVVMEVDKAYLLAYNGTSWNIVGSTASGGGGGNWPPTTDTDKSAAFTITASEENTYMVLTSAATADVKFTLDVSLLTALNSVLVFVNESSYRLQVEVSNTSTMTIQGTYTDKMIWKGDPCLTLSGDTSTNCRMH